jgi:tetratricopeptide (TPR) repeat protein
MLIGRQMIGKADEYFHGGVTDLNCSLEHHHGYGQDGLADRDDHEHGHGDHEHGHGEEDDAPVRAPWAFVTHAIRLPSIERHLEGRSTREMLPWLWAACRVDSGNISAYANAAYVLDSLYGDSEKALAVLDEGIAANPASSELEFQKGMLLLFREKASDKAEAAFAAALAKVPRDKHLENRDDIDATMIAARILAFLGKFAADRGDIATLRLRYQQARAIAPDHNATTSLKRLIDESEGR